MEKVSFADEPTVLLTEPPAAIRRKAVSYCRYSSLAQGNEGRNSVQRQRAALQAALARWNLELDQEFIDAAKSGYHQKHLTKGAAMYQLRHMALEGQLTGKVIIIEDWDRAGRMSVTDAAPLLLDILNNGVDMVVGAYGGQYFSKQIVDASPHLFYQALDEMDRGKRESKRKTDMAKAKWKARNDAVLNGQPTGLNNLPIWLVNERNKRGDCTGKFLIREGMEHLIKRIYAEYLKGDGGQVIANRLNKEGVLIPTNRNGDKRKNANIWHSTYIQKIIKSRAVMGYYRDSEKIVFPALVSENDYYKANQTRKERIRFAGRKAEHVNPYSGLCYCANCKDGRLSRHASRSTRATKDYVYLQCRSSRRGDCTAAGILYDRFEESFASLFGNIDNISNSPVEVVNKSNGIRAKIAETEGQIANLKLAFQSIKEPSQATSLAEMLTDCDVKRAQLLIELEQAVIKEKGVQNTTKADLEFLQSLFSKESQLKNPETRKIIQESLRRCVDRITIDVKTQSYVVTWKNSNDVYQVQLKDNGYTIAKNAIKFMEETELD